MITKQLYFTLYVLFCFYSCQYSAESNNDKANDIDNSKIELVPLSPKSPEFEKATLELDSYEMPEVGIVKFDFSVGAFRLGEQTPGVQESGFTNSDKGQHIHFIDNNGPYSEHYDGSFSKNLGKGNHVILVFLTRSNHESLKSVWASYITQYSFDNDSERIDLSLPMLFYSQPKGTYIGKDTKNILLDFYLHNVSLSETGSKVRATINGKEFIITNWEPYVIKGAPLGELNIKLELLDENDKLVDVPFNPSERTVLLEE